MKPPRYLKVREIKSKLKELYVEAVHLVHFADGEPTTSPDLPCLLAFCKNELGVTAKLGHTNGSLLPTENLDGANVSSKAFDPQLHLDYTGYPKEPVYENFTRAFEAGVDMKASVVFSPGQIECDDIERICEFIASHDPAIPFNITAYRTVPWLDWRRPTEAEMEQAVATGRRHLETVEFSHRERLHIGPKHSARPPSFVTVLGES